MSRSLIRTTANSIIDDLLCVLLGCDSPMLLRPTASGDFLVVGECYVHGLMDGEALLGPIPNQWRIEMRKGDGFDKPFFHNTSIGESSTEDPRLRPLPVEWEIVPRNRRQEDPYFFKDFRNRTTAEVMTSDPRMLPEVLKERGVKLETFQLI